MVVLLALPPSSSKGKGKDKGKGSTGNEEGDGIGVDVKAAAVRVVPLAVREAGAADLWGVDCEEAGSVECGLSDWNTPAMSVSSTFISRSLSAKR